MKKLLKILLIATIFCISLLGFCGCENSINFIENGTYKGENKKYDKYYMFNSGYIHNMSENCLIISTKAELDEYIRQYDQKSWDLEGNEIDGKISKKLGEYDEKYFETKSLALCYIVSSNSAQSVIIEEPEINGDTIIVKYKENSGENQIGLCVMGGELLVVEVDKSITKISE